MSNSPSAKSSSRHSHTTALKTPRLSSLKTQHPDKAELAADHPPNHTRLDENERRGARRKHGIPDSGVWFWKQDGMLMYARACGGVAIAWDKQDTGSHGKSNQRGNQKCKKMYAVYGSIDDLYACLLRLPERERYAYEVIQEKAPCRVYADLEWEGDRDDTHTMMCRVMAEVRAYCMEKHGRNPKLYVGCSTRPVDAQSQRWKNSYHLVYSRPRQVN